MGWRLGDHGGRVDHPGARGHRAQPAGRLQALQQHHIQRPGGALGDSSRKGDLTSFSKDCKKY